MIIENSGPGEKGRPVRIRTAVRRQGQVKQKELPLHAAPGRKDVDEKGVARFGTQHAAAETRLSKKRTLLVVGVIFQSKYHVGTCVFLFGFLYSVAVHAVRVPLVSLVAAESLCNYGDFFRYHES